MEAQISAVCQFCETSREIKWRCLNCDLFLCRICNSRIHSKIMSSVEHKIIHLDQCGTEEVVNNIRKLDFKQMKCKTHHDKTCFVFCRNCNQPICSLCILIIHQNHTLCEIDDAYEEKLADVENLKVEIKSNIAFITNEETLLQEDALKGKKHHMEIRTLILNREEEVKQEIARKSKDVSDELESEWHNTEQSINSDIELCLKTKSNLLKRKDNIHKILKSHDPRLVFDASLTDVKQLHLPMFGKRASLFQFFPKTIEAKGILGDLIEKPIIENITVYSIDMKCISCISHCEAEKVLICNNSEDILKKEDLNCDRFQTLKTLQDIRVMDISQTKDGHAILSVGDDLKILTKTGQLKTFLHVELITLCVHVNTENELFVGALVKDPDHWRGELGIVLILDEEGNTTCTFDKRKIVNDSDNDYITGCYDDSFDEDEEVDMFDFPSRVLNTKKDDILIIDNSNLSTYAGKVLLLNRSGDIVREYRGCRCENCNDFNFCPFDIAETHSNLILISDIGKHSIHVLGKTLITCSFVDDIGINSPLSLCIDAAGKLWIGCDMSADDDEEPKIYCITLN
ncbi:Hypothetical predicted protein [Mytilus galloprovincialis]|uniref:B box-type domain-containing protein n=1 Tax=Mytilus galloprovincialis TaxID=29158 RepID=A0A8B6EPQ0_MYTGA|nr:Hypothetical predicted protein [Mytilus galloprovincialis]